MSDRADTFTAIWRGNKLVGIAVPYADTAADKQPTSFDKELLRIFKDKADLETLCRSLATALRDWQQFDTESSDKHPCPDVTLRVAYRNHARATTDVALTQYKNLLGD